MKNKFFQIGIIAGMVMALTACYPEGAEYYSDTDLVITNYNTGYDFNGIQTYFMADSLRHIVDEGTIPDRSMDSYIISELERNFVSLGYTRLDTTDINAGGTPDVVVVVSAIKVKIENIYTYPYYPGWCWGWYCYPGYGWYYPWYGYTYVISYETGTVFWDMFDADNVDIENEIIPVEWTGAINGVLGSGVSTNQSRLTEGIDQAFLQSPYLSGN